jgi:hypothetical protein
MRSYVNVARPHLVFRLSGLDRPAKRQLAGILDVIAMTITAVACLIKKT